MWYDPRLFFSRKYWRTPGNQAFLQNLVIRVKNSFAFGLATLPGRLFDTYAFYWRWFYDSYGELLGLKYLAWPFIWYVATHVCLMTTYGSDLFLVAAVLAVVAATEFLNYLRVLVIGEGMYETEDDAMLSGIFFRAVTGGIFMIVEVNVVASFQV